MMKSQKWAKQGAKLHKIRKSKGFSVFKIRDELGVPLIYMIKLEKGKVVPTEAIMVSLAKAYGIERNRLFDIYGLVESKNAERIAALSPYLRRVANERSINKIVTPKTFEKILNELEEIVDKHNM